MRKPDGLRRGELDALHTALVQPLNWSTVCRVLTVDRELVGTVPISPGQVDLNAEDDVVRRTAPTLLDTDGLFDGPSMNLMVQFVYQLRIPALRSVAVPGSGSATIPKTIPFTIGVGDPVMVSTSPVVEVPAFTGPLVRPPSRNGDEVTLECQDRAAIAMRGVGGKTYPRRQNAVDLIEEILREKCGETKFRFPKGIRDKTEDPVTVGREDELVPWVQCQELAATLDLHLYYDAAGVCCLREYPEDPLLDVTDLVVAPGRVEPPSEIVNRVRVLGKRPKHHNAVAELPKAHDLSPESLAVGGVKQQLEVLEENSKLNTKAKVRRRANRLMKQYRRQLEETRTFDLAPIPHLDPYDRVQLGPDVFTVVLASMPLTDEGLMTLGYQTPLR